MDEVIRRLKEEDLFSGIACLHAKHERLNDPFVVAERYAKLIQNLYWQEKNLPAMIGIALAGIQYSLRAAEGASTSPETADALKAVAKRIAYNLGSFCWPGWNEAGITIDATALAIGRDAARLNLRLGQELDRGDLPISRAHWLVGAHELACGEHDAAKRSFDEAAARAQAAGAAAEALLAEGFSALADRLAQPDGGAAGERLRSIRTRLVEGEGGADFVEQLDTAERVFLGSASRTRS